ncbi:MAG: sensor histidine kinase [Lachnospiraceae bacterium]|nr:sensor histidine kinase [Lachnospiraceae bacterium]
MKTKAFKRKWNNASVMTKMLIAFIVPLVLMLVVNIYMYISINTMMERVDEIYVVNVSLNELADDLTFLQNSMKEYLESKGTSALYDYYKAEQDYRNELAGLDLSDSGTTVYALFENISNQSENYLATAGETITAKRGRNIEKYKSSYEETVNMYSDLQACIYALNNSQFKKNTSDYSVLLSSLRYMELITILILFFIGIVNVIVVFLMTKSMTMPLTTLSQAANEVAAGNFDVEVPVTEGGDEISVVSKAFDQMLESIQRYIAEIRSSVLRESMLKEHELVMENRMKEVQLRSLQAQINPHFLFNTLNAGEQLAMMEGAEKTTEFIENMADFFRYNIKKIDNDATIEEEIALVDKYVYILNVRFTGEIHYSKDIDDEVLKVRVPSMIIQPIVENAVNYGIRDIDWEGHIDLRVFQDDENVLLSIKDNGIGMKQEQIDRILSGEAAGEVSADHSASNGVGLGNVIERLQIFTGRSDVMDIISEGEGCGTEFVIKVPKDIQTDTEDKR